MNADDTFTWRTLLSFTGITGVVITLIGLTLLALGLWLIDLGGSWYYAIAGLALVVSGVLFIARRRTGLWLYGLILAGTTLWALWEVGLDGWRLTPRLLAPALLGLWVCMPWVARPLDGRGGQRNAWWGALACIALIAGVIGLGYWTSANDFRQFTQAPDAAGPAPAALAAPRDEWRYYGGSPAGDRYSPLTQITPRNVARLEAAWTFRTGDLPLPYDMQKGREFNFEATPIKVGDNLYFCTPHRRVISINAITGRKNWDFDPKVNLDANIFLSCRGVAYYDAPGDAECPRRVISTTGAARLVALNADTGIPCQSFGDRGYVDLTANMGVVPPGFHYITSQPLIINDRVMFGGWIYDNEAEGEPSGVVRAYNAATGALIWAWDLGRPDPTAPLKPGETYTRGTPNAWGTLTADPALGLVYLPMGNATPDYFGGHRRPFDDRYSSSVVALEIETGKERWSFQTVHHDLWDFDLPIGPSLVDIDTPQGVVPALVQTTKRGEFFVLDRRDGHPLTGVVEKPVPQNPVKGEYLSPTQPYPSGFPSLAPVNVTEAGTWGATPVDQLLCRIDFRRRRYDGQFTPPTLGRYLAYPAFYGVSDWYGVAIDPARRLLIANTSYLPMKMHYMTQQQALERGVLKPWKGWGHPFPKLISVADNPQYRTPYAIVIEPWLNSLKIPCVAPPWGMLTAIDLNTREIVWQRRLGTTYNSGPLGLHVAPPLPTGIFSMGGAVVTAGGVIFIGATADDYFRAFDVKTGQLLWETVLPAGGNANPMTYQGQDGRQYVVIAAGGHGGLKTTPGDYVIAFALPK